MIFALAVVAIHIDPLDGLNGQWIYKVYQSVIYLAVPFFFTASGFLMSSKLSLMDGESETKYLGKQIRKYVKLYLIWTAIYAPLAVYHYLSIQISIAALFKQILIGLFWLGESYNSFILWYLLSSIYSLFFIFIFRKMKVAYKYILLIGMIIASLAVLLVQYKYGSFTCTGMVGLLLGKASQLGARVVTGFFYIPLGIVIYLIKDRISKKYSLFLIAIGLLFEVVSSGYGFIYEIGRAVATTGIVIAVVNIFWKANEKFKVCRKLSSSLYYWHLWVYTLVCFILYGVGNMRKGSEMYSVTIAIIVVLFFVNVIFQRRKHNR